MTTLILMILIPLALSAVSVMLVRALTRNRITLVNSFYAACVGALIGMTVLGAAFYIGKGHKTSDVEVWNGQITSKQRIHDSYTRTYPCMCTTDAKGNQTCQICSEDHYTVEWRANSNIGKFVIHKLDDTSDSVYAARDPAFYTTIVAGDACSKLNTYTNYIKAVPESLFKPVSGDLKRKYSASIPAYPTSVYDHYKIDRVLTVGLKLQNQAEWNSKLANMLKELGPQKQANVVVVLTSITDANYFYALQDSWQGAKKNDIVVVIGSADGIKAEWVNVMALTDKELFKIQLRDELLDLPALTADSVISVIKTNALKTYQRKRMKDFEYLDSEIDPPLWVIVSAILLVVGGYVGGWFWVHRAYNYCRFTRRF